MKVLQAFDSELKLRNSDPLWRYMKLSTFLWLLRGEVFIPSLRKLGGGDPREGLLPWVSASSDDICLRIDHDNLLANEEAWLDQKAEQGLRDDPSDFRLDPKWGKARARLEVWFRELQKRRAAWCWHQSADESMALWNGYAHHGVAVRSDLESIRQALGLADDWELLAGKLAYKNPNYCDEDYFESCGNSIMCLSRPFMFKSADYKYEQEIRLVLKVDARRAHGLRIPVDSTILLKEVVISPHLVDSEQWALVKIFKATLEGTSVEVRPSASLRRESYQSDFGENFMSELIKPSTVLHEPLVTAIKPAGGALNRLPFAEEKDIPERLKVL